MDDNKRKEVRELIKQHRVLVPLTLKELSEKSGVSPSHLGRIERGERFPSACILRRIAKPLGFEEEELFILAGYLSPKSATGARKGKEGAGGRLDPYVAHLLAQEPIKVQRMVISILIILKSLAKR